MSLSPTQLPPGRASLTRSHVRENFAAEVPIRGAERYELMAQVLCSAFTAIFEYLPTWSESTWEAELHERCRSLKTYKDRFDGLADVERIGADGMRILQDVFGYDGPPGMRELGPVETLRRVWVQEFEQPQASPRLRADRECPPPNLRILTKLRRGPNRTFSD